MATIVLVSGFLAPADEGVLRGYWSGFSAYLDESTAGARVLVARELSPVGSLHDRALQLFGELYGGAVTADVARGGAGAGAGAGAQSLSPSPSPPPSAAHHRGAKRGRLGVWDEEHPVHLVGHSYGGQTCRVLHEYLARGLFRCGGEPVRSSSAWVRSVTCVNAPLNGSRVVHALGLPRGSPYVAPFSAGYWLTLLMENAARFGPERLAAAIRMPPAHLRGSLPRRLRQLLHNIVGSSRVTGTGDSAASDLSPAASAAWNRFLRTHGTTYYLSIAGSAAATPAPGPARLSPLQLFKAAFLWTMAARRRRAAAAAAAAPCGCGRVDCEACEILGDSDGVAGTNSQGSPPGAPRCAAQLFDLEGGGASVARRGAESVVAPGVWHVQEAACDHLCLAGLPTSDPRASRFADQLVALLRTVDKAGARAGARAGAAADGIGRAAAPPALAKPRAEPPGGDSGGALGAAVLLAPLGGIGAALFATASVAEAALLTAALALTLAAFRRRAPRPPTRPARSRRRRRRPRRPPPRRRRRCRRPCATGRPRRSPARWPARYTLLRCWRARRPPPRAAPSTLRRCFARRPSEGTGSSGGPAPPRPGASSPSPSRHGMCGCTRSSTCIRRPRRCCSGAGTCTRGRARAPGAVPTARGWRTLPRSAPWRCTPSRSPSAAAAAAAAAVAPRDGRRRPCGSRRPLRLRRSRRRTRGRFAPSTTTVARREGRAYRARARLRAPRRESHSAGVPLLRRVYLGMYVFSGSLACRSVRRYSNKCT